MKILFAGEGGQGVQAVAEILAKASFTEGKHASYIPNFGVEQRGGVSLAFVVVAKQPIVYPKFEKADILAVLSDRSWDRVKRYINRKTKIILGPATTRATEKRLPRASVRFRLKERKLPSKVWNIMVLGKINRVGEIVSQESLVGAMDERFARQFKKNPKLRQSDLEALRG